MVHLTKIYTKTGDDGTTGLADGSRTAKFMPRMMAIGSVDEANSAIGMISKDGNRAIFDQIQNDLFDIGAVIAGSKTVSITDEHIEILETYIDGTNALLDPLDSFVLPTGTIHNARAIVRRAERDVWYWYATDMDGHAHNEFDNKMLIYLNRLSDLLFVMARYYNKGNEILWNPMGKNEK
mgnify:CR=1 FL=1